MDRNVVAEAYYELSSRVGHHKILVGDPAVQARDMDLPLQIGRAAIAASCWSRPSRRMPVMSQPLPSAIAPALKSLNRADADPVPADAPVCVGLRPRMIGALLLRRASRRASNQNHNLPQWFTLAIGRDFSALASVECGLGILAGAIIEGGRFGWCNAFILGGVAAAGMLAALFALQERWAEQPMLPLQPFRRRAFAPPPFER
jgi:hypothetical protein